MQIIMTRKITMTRKLKFTSIFIILIAISQISYAQVYLGGGRVVSQFSPLTLDEHLGFGAIVQRQIYFKESKFSLTPTLQGSLLTGRQYSAFLPEFYTTVSVSTHINFDVISTKKFRITPFVGPSFIWATGLNAGGVIFDDEPVNFYRLGLEGGMSLTYVFSDKFSVKIIPLSYTWGTKDFVQGNVLSLLFQIM